jgi:hypothetical protein
LDDADWEDPIVKEIHEIRARMAEECGYDMARIVEYIAEKAAVHRAESSSGTPAGAVAPDGGLHLRSDAA